MTENGSIPQSLVAFFEDNPRPALAFSGGADSTYLMYVCSELDVDVVPLFAKGPFQSEDEISRVTDLSHSFGYDVSIIDVDPLSDGRITRNDSDRCYHCKRMIFSAISELAGSEGRYVMDGTNASDDLGDRPGMRALSEMGIRSPLRECGITKAQVREYSRLAGLPTWDLPSNSCLATRIPTGTAITLESLRKVDSAEKELRSIGLKDFRVRIAGSGARLETIPSQKDILESDRRRIEEILLKYFDNVTYGERKPSL